MSQQSLEMDILKWVAKNTADESIRVQCEAVEVVSRKYSGVGSFSRLKTGRTDERSPLRVADVSPDIESPELPLGGGSVLFLEDGLIDLLEIYVYGSDDYPSDIGAYKLTDK